MVQQRRRGSWCHAPRPRRLLLSAAVLFGIGYTAAMQDSILYSKGSSCQDPRRCCFRATAVAAVLFSIDYKNSHGSSGRVAYVLRTRALVLKFLLLLTRVQFHASTPNC